MSGDLLLRGGRIVDPSIAQDGRADVRIRVGRVSELGELAPEPGERVIDVDGLVVAPGLVDVHVHLREPGQEWKETIATGTAAAAAGGFTTLFCMPNTEPPLDSVAALEELQRRIDRDAVVTVRPIATISEGRRGDRAADYVALAAAGAVGFSDDGESTGSAAVMEQALAATRVLGVPVMVHCEEAALTGGAMHLGDISQKLQIPGIAPLAEEMLIDRDLAVAELTGGWLHVCHVSTAAGAAAIAAARTRGVRVTAELMPHHLTMTDEWVAGSRRPICADGAGSANAAVAHPDTKVNPPLRTARDVRYLLEALKRRVIEVIATDHAPHGRAEKEGRTFHHAAFGLSGSELALPTLLALVRAGQLTLADLVRALSTTPARLWGLHAGTLRPGARADVAVFDMNERWLPSAERLNSRGANTPLLGTELLGRVKLTLVGGDERYRDR